MQADLAVFELRTSPPRQDVTDGPDREGLHASSVFLLRVPRPAKVDCPGSHILQGLRGRRVGDADLDLPVLLMEGLKVREEESGAGSCRRPRCAPSPRSRFCMRRDHLLPGLQKVHPPGDIGKENLSLPRELHAPCGSDKERRPEALLEVFELLGDRRLGDGKRLCRRGDRALPCDDEKCPVVRRICSHLILPVKVPAADCCLYGKGQRNPLPL